MNLRQAIYQKILRNCNAYSNVFISFAREAYLYWGIPDHIGMIGV